MNRMAYAGLILTLAVASLPSGADAKVAVYRQNDISYASGGAGDEEQDELAAMRERFNLKVTMALNNGNFVGGANVRIQDADGKTVLDAVADGPILLAALKPGTYTVAATLNGKKLEKPAQVAAGGQQEVTFTCAAE
jgi:hypothetical protein